MKKQLISLLLVISLCASLLLAGCTKPSLETTSIPSTTAETVEDDSEPVFTGLNDQALLEYIEDNIYASIIDNLNSDEYYIEKVSTQYVSKEYLEELEYNSKDNIYFGYNLKALEEQFQGTSFVFVPDEANNKTIVKQFEKYDDTFDVAVKDLATGSGVILTLVTISAISAKAGNVPMCILFASYAADAAKMASSYGALGGTAAGLIEGIQTKDKDQALKAAVSQGSHDFKWAAIMAPAVSVTETGIIAKQLSGLKLNGLTYKEAVAIQKKTHYPTSVICKMQNVKEYKVYKKLKLTSHRLKKGEWFIGKKIDLDTPFEFTSKGKTITTTNRQRIKDGLVPIDIKTGQKIELHHIGQELDSPFALLTEGDHDRFSSILHTKNKKGVHSQLSDAEWTKIRQTFWKDYVTKYGGKQ